MKNYIIIILAVVTLISLIFNIKQFSNISGISEGISGITGTGVNELQPNYKCDSTGVELYCFSVSSSFKTCYTLPNNLGGKRCLDEPYWHTIPIVILECPVCPICKDGVCPICKEGTCPNCQGTICPSTNSTCSPCVQTCNGCGGGGGSSSCPSCPSCQLVSCDKINVIAYTDSGKWFCNGIGKEANCVKDGTLEMPFG